MLSVPALAIHDGQPMADSRDVAVTFKRQHKHVLEAYRNCHCTADFRQRNFRPFEINDLTGTSLFHVLMTKSGFSFLVLGFTGAEAGSFKEAYIERFDDMEAEIARRAPARIDVRDPGQLAIIATQLIEVNRELADRMERVEKSLAVAAPKAEALDRIADTEGLLAPSDAAKTLGVSPKSLIDHLMQSGWCFRRESSGRPVAYQDKLDAGLLRHKAVPISEGRTVTQVYVTPKGLTRLARELGITLAPADPSSRSTASPRGP